MAAGWVRPPRRGSEVTGSWLGHALRTYEGRRDPGGAVGVEVTKFEVKAGTKPGENVASELVKIWVEARVTRGGKEEEEEEEEKGHEQKEEEEVKENKDREDTQKREKCENQDEVEEEEERKEKDSEKRKESEEEDLEKKTNKKPQNNNNTAKTDEYNLETKEENEIEFQEEDADKKGSQEVDTEENPEEKKTKQCNLEEDKIELKDDPDKKGSQEEMEIEKDPEDKKTTQHNLEDKIEVLEEDPQKRRSSHDKNPGYKRSSPNTSRTTTKQYHLMGKFNTGSEVDREYNKYTHTDLKEFLVYSQVVGELNAFQHRETGGAYPLQVPEYIYGECSEGDFVLLMQDVSVLGYKTEDKEKGLDLPHILMAADHLARLHALSYAYHRRYDFLKRFPTFETNQSLISFFTGFIGVIFDGAVEVLNSRPDLAPIKVKLTENRDLLLAKMGEMMRLDGEHRVVCLSHGDSWTNNLMYRHEGHKGTGSIPHTPAEDAQTPETPTGDVKTKETSLEDIQTPQTPKEDVQTRKTPPDDLLLIDWGLVVWRNPILDLHQLVYNCTTRSFRRQHLQEVLKKYHDTFTAATRDLGAPVPNYNLQAFLKEWKRTSIFGFIHSGIFANAITMSKKASEGFVKGTPSEGFKGLVAKGVAKVMVPLIVRGWLTGVVLGGVKKNFAPLFEEVRSGVNPILTSTLVEVMEEAFEAGALDP